MRVATSLQTADNGTSVLVGLGGTTKVTSEELKEMIVSIKLYIVEC